MSKGTKTGFVVSCPKCQNQCKCNIDQVKFKCPKCEYKWRK